MTTPAPHQKWQTRQDGLDNLYLTTASRDPVPLPVPGPDQVLVRIAAVSLNYRDTEVIMGLYNHHKTIDPSLTEPLVPCSDMAGHIIALGPQTLPASDNGPPEEQQCQWRVGDRVMSTFIQSHLTGQIKASDMAQGLGKPLECCLQTYRVFPATGLVRTPDYLTDEEASCLPIAALTAWMAMNGMRDSPEHYVGPGETVLLQGTGGVSVSGLQIAKAAGATGE